MIESIPLYSLTTGRGRVHVILLHGLFGSISNMRPLARGLEAKHRVTCLDLRNHGKSGHTDSMRYEEMAMDVLCYVQDQHIKGPLVLIGHSMGGKVAMSCALLQSIVPIHALVVLDIAPVCYLHDLTRLVHAMQAVTGHLDKGRQRVDELLLQRDVIEPGLRTFLLKNMTRDERGHFRWRLNLQSIEDNIADIHAFPEQLSTARYRAPTLFVTGAHSSYVHTRHHPTLFGHFPEAQLVSVPDTGHWLHTEKSEEVGAHIRAFLDGVGWG